MEWELRTFNSSDVDAIVKFWNTTFRSRRNFVKLTKKLFNERIRDRESVIVDFDPELYLLAKKGDTVLGIVHCGIFKKLTGRLLLGSSEMTGFLGIIAVQPSYRKMGIGTALYNKAIEVLKLKGASRMILDGQCLNPFYGNSDSLEQPFFDTPEGISIPADDEGSRHFFFKLGFQPRFKGITMELKLKNIKYKEMQSSGGLVVRQENSSAQSVIKAFHKDSFAGEIVMIRMRFSDPNRWGIHRFEVSDDYRGKGVGKLLFNKAIKRLKNMNAKYLECITLKEVSSDAIKFYENNGFKRVCEWHIY